MRASGLRRIFYTRRYYDEVFAGAAATGQRYVEWYAPAAENLWAQCAPLVRKTAAEGRRAEIREAVELGCGVSRFAEDVHADLGCTVVGVDFSEPAVSAASSAWGPWGRAVLGDARATGGYGRNGAGVVRLLRAG